LEDWETAHWRLVSYDPIDSAARTALATFVEAIADINAVDPDWIDLRLPPRRALSILVSARLGPGSNVVLDPQLSCLWPVAGAWQLQMQNLCAPNAKMVPGNLQRGPAAG